MPAYCAKLCFPEYPPAAPLGANVLVLPAELPLLAALPFTGPLPPDELLPPLLLVSSFPAFCVPEFLIPPPPPEPPLLVVSVASASDAKFPAESRELTR